MGFTKTFVEITDKNLLELTFDCSYQTKGNWKEFECIFFFHTTNYRDSISLFQRCTKSILNESSNLSNSFDSAFYM